MSDASIPEPPLPHILRWAGPRVKPSPGAYRVPESGSSLKLRRRKPGSPLLQALRDRAAALPPHIAGVLLAVTASASFASMHNTVRYVTADLHPFEVAFFRNLFGVLFLVPWFATVGVGPLRTRHVGKHLVRSLVNAASMLMWFTALSLMPVADATSLALVGPVFVALGAMAFLKERVGPRRWLGITASQPLPIPASPQMGRGGFGTWPRTTSRKIMCP